MSPLSWRLPFSLFSVRSLLFKPKSLLFYANILCYLSLYARYRVCCAVGGVMFSNQSPSNTPTKQQLAKNPYSKFDKKSTLFFVYFCCWFCTSKVSFLVMRLKILTMLFHFKDYYLILTLWILIQYTHYSRTRLHNILIQYFVERTERMFVFHAIFSIKTIADNYFYLHVWS